MSEKLCKCLKNIQWLKKFIQISQKISKMSKKNIHLKVMFLPAGTLIADLIP